MRRKLAVGIDHWERLWSSHYPINRGRASTTGRNQVWTIPRSAFIDQPAGTETDPD